MISILTTTYNRNYSLPRLFNSLRCQNSAAFEWVVVDDGSVDSSSKFLRECQVAAEFPVSYLYQENGGKHRALNAGVPLCRGDWVLIVDSDDFLSEDAISIIESSLRNMPEDVVGLCFRKSHIDGAVIGQPLVNEVKVMRPVEAVHYYDGDLAYVFKQSVMMACVFPVYEGEKFVPELCVWNKISDYGRIVYYSGVSFYRCEYLPDGYSANFKTNLRRNCRGFAFHYLDALKRERVLIYKLKALVRWLQCYWYILLK